MAGLNGEYHLPLLAISEEQLKALLEALKADTSLQEKLKGAADLDAVLAMAQEAGFDVSKADLLKYQAKQTLELSDEELESVAGGGFWDTDWWCGWALGGCDESGGMNEWDGFKPSATSAELSDSAIENLAQSCLIPKALVTAEAFYFFNNTRRIYKPSNTWHHCHQRSPSTPSKACHPAGI